VHFFGLRNVWSNKNAQYEQYEVYICLILCPTQISHHCPELQTCLMWPAKLSGGEESFVVGGANTCWSVPLTLSARLALSLITFLYEARLWKMDVRSGMKGLAFKFRHVTLVANNCCQWVDVSDVYVHAGVQLWRAQWLIYGRLDL
jgi:hypothetical protein